MTPRTSKESASEPSVVLRAENLKVWFPIKRGLLKKTVGHVRAVDGVSLELREGETLGLVGESGCGKTTLVHALLRLIEPTAGNVTLTEEGKSQDLLSLNRSALRLARRQIQLVFQNPASSMSPRMTVGDIIAEPLRIHGIGTPAEREARVRELLKEVGLNPFHSRRFSGSFSGGQRQRVGIARALALRPKVVITDEPVSALDVSVQSQILNLLNDLKERFGLTYLFIAHNLNVVKFLSDRIAVMYLGSIVEVGSSSEVYHTPLHPYTASLLQAIPITHPKNRNKARRVVQGDLPDPADPPVGCRFHPRCPFAKELCRTQRPELKPVAGTERKVACHLSADLKLEGGVE